MIRNSWMHLKRGIQQIGNIFKKMYLKIYVLYLKRKSRYVKYQILSLSVEAATLTAEDTNEKVNEIDKALKLARAAEAEEEDKICQIIKTIMEL